MERILAFIVPMMKEPKIPVQEMLTKGNTKIIRMKMTTKMKTINRMKTLMMAMMKTKKRNIMTMKNTNM